MRVLIVTGDRNATKYPAIASRWELVLREALAAFKRDAATVEPCLLIHGACGLDADAPGSGAMKGIDALADCIGRELGYLVAALPAHWTTQGPPAGPRRNEQMIAHGRRFQNDGATVAVYAFHDQISFSKGTKGTVELAQRYGLFVTRHRSDGAWG